MKMNIEFDFNSEDSPDTESAVRTFLDGPKWKSILQEFDNFLRNKMKYEDVETFDGEELRSYLYELINDENLDLWSE